MKHYSQAGQDLFVLHMIEKQNDYYFVDIGCWLPFNINNTFLLEQNGWDGLSIDITDLHKEWEERKTKFIQSDALVVDYRDFFDKNNSPLIIDYLNIDIEGDGLRFKTLIKIFESNREYKIITIEHDDYRGYSQTEKEPQRDFLIKKGYILICGDVCLNGNSFEDWWINPKFINEKKYKDLIMTNVEYIEIMNKIKK